MLLRTLGLPKQLPESRDAALSYYADALAIARDQDEELRRRGEPPMNVNTMQRWLCRNDLFYLLVYGCRRPDINHDWLFARCREVQAAPNGILDLWAREHYKSTIITFGLSLQDILASHGADAEPRYHGREVTIGILSFNRPTAKAFLRQIKQEMEMNEPLKRLFPDILWPGSPDEIKRMSPKWSEDEGLIVKRKTNPKEATLEAHGLVDGQPTGKHYFLRVYDDVVTKESVTTPEMILKVTQAWELSSNLGTEDGEARYIGTRYALHDTYKTMIDRGIPTRVYPCTSDGSEDFDNKSVFASPAYLKQKRRDQGPYTFGAQMLLNPSADKAQGFREEWLRYWPAVHSDGLNIYMVVDPASKRKKSDYTTMWIVGIDGAKNWMVLDLVRDRLNLVERQRTVFALHRKWRPLAVGYEEYGLQADIEHIRFVQELENYRFTITTLGGAMPKEDRIRRLIPLFEAGRIFLPSGGIVRTDYEGRAVDVVRSFLEEEYHAFPVVAHDDGLDALARLTDPMMGITGPTPPPEAEPKWLTELYAETDQGVVSWETL